MRAVATLAMAALSALLMCWPIEGHAQRSDGVKELMGKAQSESERRAVEDLINKLQGRAAPPKAPAEETPAAKAAVPVPAPALPAPVAKPAVATPAAPVTIPVAPPPPPAVAAPKLPEPSTPAAAEPVRAPVAVPEPASPPAPVSPPAPAKPAPEPASAAAPTPPSTPPVAPPRAAAPKETPAPGKAAKAAPVTASPIAQSAAIADKGQVPAVDLEIFFEFASANLTPEATASLDTLGRSLIDPRLADQTFIIGGYTDGKGKPDYNLRLSQLRAEAVRNFLIKEFRIDPKRLIAKGFGKSQMKNSANPDADENRRVQIINWTSQIKR